MANKSKCMECTNAKGFSKDAHDRLIVDCQIQGKRRARGHKNFCIDFNEHYDFILINMGKPFEKWEWIRKEEKSNA